MRQIKRNIIFVTVLFSLFSMTFSQSQKAPQIQGTPGGTGGMQPGSPSDGQQGGSSGEGGDTSAPPAIPKPDVQSYHGLRMSSEHCEFSVVFIEVEDSILRLGFSVPVSPGTLRATNIILNGKPLDKKTSVRFNRSGKVAECKIQLPPGEESVLELKNVRSFDGYPLRENYFKELFPGASVTYPLPAECTLP